MMKKLLSFLLAAVLVLSLAACGAPKQTPETTTTTEPLTSGTTQTEPAATQPVSTADTNGSKVLVLYFSAANTAGADVVSSATPKVDDNGVTAYLAGLIHEKVGGDLAAITPEQDYPTDYNGTVDAAKRERDADERPAFLPLGVNPEDYDVLFIGYPIWWYTLPMVLYTFFDTYDLAGKTIVPFNTHAGSGDGGTYDEIADFEPGATVLDGLAISGSSVGQDSAQQVESWLRGLPLG